MEAIQNVRLQILAYSLVGLGLATAAGTSDAVPADAQIDLKVLIIAGQQRSQTAPYELQAAKAALDRIGTPYYVHYYDETSSTPSLPPLEIGNHALYQAILLPLGDSNYMNPFWGNPAAKAIERYQFKYSVRLASLYTWPGNTGCLVSSGTRDATAAPALPSRFTAAGAALFPYMRAGTSAGNPPLNLTNAYIYFSSVASPLPAGTTVTPVLQATGTNNVTYTVAATCSFSNAAALPEDSTTREILAFTFDHNAGLTHTIALSYGVVNWLTKGLFLGSRRIYLDAQVDDVGIPDEIYPYAELPNGWYDVRTNPWTFVGTACPLGDVNPSTGTSACEYRITGAEFSRAVAWQEGIQSNTASAGAVRLNMAYNGAGFGTAYGGLGEYPPTGTDSLSAQVDLDSFEFKWTSHTFDHDLLDPLTYGQTLNSELIPNDAVSQNFGFSKYAKKNLVTPEISGLYSPDPLRAMVAFGTAYVVSDSSRPTPPVGTVGCPRTTPQGTNWPLPAFNAGKYNCVNQGIYEVPRYPTALFYNVSTPQEWTNEYNYFYGANGIDPTGWGVDQSYDDVVRHTSDTLLTYLLNGEMRPWMFHQSNLRAYDGSTSLLSHLLDVTLAKYNSYYKSLPIRSLTLNAAGDLMKQREVYNGSEVTAVLSPGKTITLGATRPDTIPVVIPVTGVSFGTSKETYGGQSTSFITVAPGTNVVVTPAPAWQ